MWHRLFRAEWRKIIGHRWATGCMIWVFPGIAVLIGVFGVLAAALSSDLQTSLIEEPARWTDAALSAWAIPTNVLGRLLLVGFTAVIFAGEYQWNTWKVIVPRTQRVPLILVKFFTVAVFVVLAFALMSLLLTVGIGLISAVAGASYGPDINREVLRDFAKDYGVSMFAAFVTTVIAAGIAALAATITRSILGSAVIGIVVTIGENLLILPLWFLAGLLDADFFQHIYRYTPGYNLNRLIAYMFGEVPEELELQSGALINDTQLFSVMVLAVWMVGLVSLTAYLFQRQDVTN
jgi:ABC-type transport system involved in multi-copper enzyme maturation permease subunit